MKKIVFLLSFFALSNVFAQAERSRLVTSIKNKAAGIQKEISFSDNLTVSELREIENLLVSAADILRNGGGQNDNLDACIDFAYKSYNRGMNSSDAMVRAQKRCVGVEDMQIAEFAFSKYNRGMSTTEAMDRTLEMSRGGVKGKLALLEYAFDKHNRGNVTADAMTMSIQNIRIVSLNRGLECFERYFPTFNRGNTTSDAMNRTAESCR
jgi:O-phosphoseryl-tRNA(Cys) synthetase